MIGERQTSENWVAVVTRTDGKPGVQSCFDQSRRPIAGISKPEPAEKAVLIATAPADDLPPIVAPKP